MKKTRGFTLIELLVGMVVALLASLAIFQIFNTSEAFKRSTTAGSDALQNGVYAQFMLGRSLAMGGSGISQLPNVWGCSLRLFRDSTQVVGSSSAYDSFGAPFQSAFKTGLAGRSYALPIAPTLILDGGSSADTLLVMSGQHASIGYYLTPNAQPASDTVSFNGATGINATCSTTTSSTNCVTPQQDLLLAVDQDSGAGSTTCDVAQAMSVSAGVVSLTGTSSASHSHTGGSAFNGYSKSTLIANLGPLPVSSGSVKTTSGPAFTAYGIDSGNNLVELNLITGEQRTLADNIVSIKAIYGVSADSTASHVGSWVSAGASGWTADSITSTRIQTLRAVRLAVVARNALKEKTQVTASSLTLFADTAVSKTLNIAASERYYRYKVYDLIIPLRNMVIAAS